MIWRPLGGALLAVSTLAACDPAGPADGRRVQIIPILNPEDRPSSTTASGPGTASGAPLDAIRPDVSPVASSAQGTTETSAQSSSDLAAATTEALSETPQTANVSADGAALAAFAQAQSHGLGEAVFARDFASAERAERACARYASPDQAQTAFLSAGGPQADPRGLDPDGDGYVCGWDPAAFRSSSAG